MTGRGRTLLAVALANLAYATFTGMDTLVKLLSESFHPVQIACLVALVGMVPPVLAGLLRGGPRRLATRRPGVQLVRGLAMLVGGVAAFMAYALMPLADAYAVNFTQPLIITALAVPLLRERVEWQRWLAVAIGFMGVLVMLRPGGGVLGMGAMFALVNAFGNGLALLLVRRLGPDETAEACVLWGNATIVLGTAPLLFWLGRMPDLQQALLFLAAGACGGIAFLLLSRAYQMAAAGLLAPFQYCQMPYALVVGLLVFGQGPNLGTILGAAIVIASGLYLLERERRRPEPP